MNDHEQPTTPADLLALDWLKELETVSLCVPDGVGRLVGKRIGVEHLATALDEGLPMPDFHLATDINNVALHGLNVTGPHTGFPNGLLRPDVSTLRRLPWDLTSAVILCDTYDHDGMAVVEAPRAILRHQTDRLRERGLEAMVATELEFYVFSNSYEALSDTNYSQLKPLYHRHGDHDVLVTGFLDRFLAPVRQAMATMGVPALSTIGEGGVGQVEINFGHGDPLTTADHHVLFKHTTKALAEQHRLAATFMAKPDEAAPGSGCHIHLSLWDATDSSPVTPSADDSIHLGERARAFLAGVLEYSADLAVLHAPYANSYRRLQPGSWAPTAATWGYDNRTVLARVLGSGRSLRVEFRLPGADVNPYLSIAALLASGIAGLDERAALTAPSAGDASVIPVHTPPAALPQDLGQATRAFDASSLACEAFGATVHAHLAARAKAEWASATRAVTDWDRRHGFEGA